MSNSKYSIQELYKLQGLSLSDKVRLTKTRIIEWATHYGIDNCYISFSGGKDSTVLLDIARRIYPDIKAVFINTGLEFPEIQKFAMSKENVEVIKPQMNFRDVIIQYGYPMISKEVSETVMGARKYLKQILESEAMRERERESYQSNQNQHNLKQNIHTDSINLWELEIIDHLTSKSHSRGGMITNTVSYEELQSIIEMQPPRSGSRVRLAKLLNILNKDNTIGGGGGARL